MAEQKNRQLWLYSAEGAHRLCNEVMWRTIFFKVSGSGWQPPSQVEPMWLESTLVQYRPGSYFPSADAHSFAEAMEKLIPELVGDFPPEYHRFFGRLAAIFRTGPIFIWTDEPKRTTGTDSVQVVHVYTCQKCGFMHHGNWMYSVKGSGTEEIRESVEAALKHKYCPICNERDIHSDVFVLPELDPAELPDLL